MYFYSCPPPPFYQEILAQSTGSCIYYYVVLDIVHVPLETHSPPGVERPAASSFGLTGWIKLVVCWTDFIKQKHAKLDIALWLPNGKAQLVNGGCGVRRWKGQGMYLLCWLPPSEPPWAEALNLYLRPLLQRGSPTPTVPALLTLGTSPPFVPSGLGMLTVSASPKFSQTEKGIYNAETSEAHSVTPTTTKCTFLACLAFGVGAHSLPHPPCPQVGRSLPWGSAMGSIPTKLEDIDPMTIAVLPFFAWGADYRLRDCAQGWYFWVTMAHCPIIDCSAV